MHLVLVSTLALFAHLIHQKTTVRAPAGVQAPPEQSVVMLWDGAKMRTDHGTESSTIMDYKNDRILMLDHTHKQYTEQKISETIRQLKAQAQNLPKAQREAMQGMLGQKGLALESTRETEKILGFDARKYRLLQGGKPAGEVWYTKAIDATDIAPYTKRFAEMTKGVMGSGWAEVLAKTENGYPLRSSLDLEVMGQRATYLTETTHYEKRSATPAAFLAPEAYRKVSPAPLPLGP